ncbi:putative quinol monooxygenase [Arthrobacter sp. NyZ413]|uniref:putative quinol monooxygenase n=1 Tax=Arthrobacter sp. NyZ413 TaxID=3144669 RepID=UPI003BF82795
MTEVHLSGQLVCSDTNELAAVVLHLPNHVALTRAEAGCISFHVSRTGNPLVWQVEERFRDAEAFHAHQHRATNSDWGRATAGIERRYTVEGL